MDLEPMRLRRAAAERTARTSGPAVRRRIGAAAPGRALPPGDRLFAFAAEALLHRLYPRCVTGLDHYAGRPGPSPGSVAGTLVVSNHRRDTDGPVLGTVLIRRHRGRMVGPLPHFVARADLFERGFLGHYLRRCPALLRPLLGRIRLRGCLDRVNAHPMQRLHECSVAHALEDVIALAGDLSVTAALRPRAQAALAAEFDFDPDTTTVAQLLRTHGHALHGRWYGYRHLALVTFRRIKPRLRTTIEQQLDRIADLLENGQTVLLEPEGRISHDGYLGRPRAVLHELVNRPARPVRVLPVAVTYDSLTTGPMRIFVDIQPEMTGLGGLPRRRLEEKVMGAVRAGCRVTAAQLLAGFLLDRLESAWGEAELIAHIHAAAGRCRADGMALDPGLHDRPSCERRVRDLLAWGLGAGFLQRDEGGRWWLRAPAMPPPWLPDDHCTLLGYLHAELLETVGAARARELELVPRADDS